MATFFRRWGKIGAGVLAGVVTVVGLFIALQTIYGFEIIDLTGDFACIGSYEQPCISEFAVKNPTKYNVDIYNDNQLKMDFSPSIEEYGLFVKDGRCTATGACACVLDDGRKLGFKGWRCTDFTEATKSRGDVSYVFRFPAYSETIFRLAGIKNMPSDTVKWTFSTKDNNMLGKEVLDPVWHSYNGASMMNLSTNGLMKGLIVDVPLTSVWSKNSTYTCDKSVNSNYGIATNGAVIGDNYSTLDGTNDIFNFSDSDYLDFGTSDFTICTWIRTSASTIQYIISKRTSGISTAGWQMAIIGGYILSPYVADGVNNSGSFTTGTILNDGIWHHVCMIVDRNVNVCKTYDGKADGCRAFTSVGSVNNDYPVYVGSRADLPASSYFNGEIFGLRAWNRALTEAEVKMEYDTTRGGGGGAGASGDSYQAHFDSGTLLKGLQYDAPLSNEWAEGLSIFGDSDLASTNGWTNITADIFLANATPTIWLGDNDNDNTVAYKSLSISSGEGYCYNIQAYRNGTSARVIVVLFGDTSTASASNLKLPGASKSSSSAGEAFGKSGCTNATATGLAYPKIVINNENSQRDVFVWKMDLIRTAGILKDRSPYHNNGVVTGSIIGNNSVTFDGATGYVNTSTDWIGTGADSFSGWMYLIGYGEGNNGRILWNGNLIITTGATNTKLYFTSDGGTTTASTATGSLSLNQWYHFAGTRDATGAATNLYLNGVLSGTANQDSGTPATGSAVLIGNQGDDSRTINGQLANIKSWNRVLTAEEVKLDFDSTCSKFGRCNP